MPEQYPAVVEYEGLLVDVLFSEHDPQYGPYELLPDEEYDDPERHPDNEVSDDV